MGKSKNLTLEEKYLSVISDFEVKGELFVGTVDDDLIYLAKKGEKHAIADILYFAENKDDEDLFQKHFHNFRHLNPKVYNLIKNSKFINDLKLEYFQSTNFISADDYMILAQLMATDDDRNLLSFYAAKSYLSNFRDYKKNLDGAMFIKVLERNAEITKTEIETCPVAKLFKTYLLWGNDQEKEKSFKKLIYNVKTEILKRTKNKTDITNRFVQAFVIRNDKLKKREIINSTSFKMFLDLSNEYEGSIIEPDTDFVKVKLPISSASYGEID